MPRQRDPLWQYGEELGENKLKCKFCEEVFGGGITRFRNHLAKRTLHDVKMCDKVPENVCEMARDAISFKERTKRQRGSVLSVGSACTGESLTSSVAFPSSSGQQLVDTMIKKHDKDHVDNLICRSMVMNNLSFNLLRSEEYREAIHAAIAYGPTYVLPSSETLRTKLLKNVKDVAISYVNDIKNNWKTSGCTLMSDTWTDMKNRPYINCLVACPQGTVFFKSICAQGNIKNGAFIADFISSVIDEIEPRNVVQFVTDNGSNYISAGDILENKYPNIFKTQCAAHCIDLMLEDIDKLPFVKPYMDSARRIVKFLYRYQHVLDLLRVHTQGRELQRPATTRFATQFICLQSVLSQEDALRLMVASVEWRNMPQCKKSEGKDVADVLRGDEFWEGGKKVIQIVEPLVKILRMVDGDGSTMGYLYEGLNRAIAAIRSLYPNHDDQDKCMEILSIIDQRWKKNLHSPLHAVAAFLHPKFFYENIISTDSEIRDGLDKVITKMAPRGELRETFRELSLYHSRDPKIFGGTMSHEMMQTSHPRLWWDLCGTSIPNLKSIAIKILSQPCSASACERTWSVFEATYSKRRNRLHPEKLQDLVYVKVNLLMKKNAELKLSKDSKAISLDDINPFDGFNEENEENQCSSEDDEDDTPLEELEGAHNLDFLV